MGKKVLSFLLSVVLSLSLMPCMAAMADPENEKIELNERKDITWADDTDVDRWFSFTPDADGSYAVVVESDLGGVDGYYSYGAVFEATEEQHLYTDSHMDGTKNTIGDVFALEKEQTYSIWITRNNAVTSSVTMKKEQGFSEMSAGAGELKLGEEKKITLNNDNEFYYDLLLKFEIEEDGNYRFVQKNLKDIWLLKEDGKSYDDFFKSTLNPLPISLKKGTYYAAYDYNKNCPEEGSGPVEGSVLLQVAPVIKGISLEKRESTDPLYTPLYYGKDSGSSVGEWKTDGSGNRYFEFFEYCVRQQFKIMVEYTDGTKEEILDSENVTWDYDPAAFSVGEDNPVTVTVDGKTAKGNITVYERLDEVVNPDSLSLKPDTPVETEDYGSFLFTAPEKGTYYFYSSSEGKIDPYADLYLNDNEVIDDDGMGDMNFLIKREMEGGEKCYLITMRERNHDLFGLGGNAASDGQKYSVTVSKTNPLDKALDLSGTDLSRKRIDLVLVINSSTTLEAEIGQLKDSIAGFVGKMAKTGADLRIALIDYADITKDNGEKDTVIHMVSGNSIWYGSGDTDALKKELEGLKTTDNTDLSDCAVDALGNLISQEKTGYDQKAAKAAVLLTDYGSKDDNTHGIADMNELTEKLKEKGILVSVMTDKQYFNSYMALADGTGGILQRIYNDDPEKNDMSLNLSRLAVFLTEYTDKNIGPYEDEENTVSDNTVSDNSVSDNAVPDNPAQSDIITLSIGSSGYTISYTGTVSFNGVSHIEKGGKTSKKKAGDIEIKLIDPSGSEVTSGYKVKFKNNRNASDNGAYFTIKMKGIDKSVKNAVKAEKFYFRINPLDLSKVTPEAKKVSEAKIRGLSFTNETGAKIKLKPVKGSKGDFSIKGLSGNYVMIEGQGNYTGNGLVPLK